MAARRPPDDDRNHERLYVKVQREERKVIPPVQLARQEIRMTYLPSEQPVPCIITTSSEGGRRQETQGIVGTEVGPPGSQDISTQIQHGASGVSEIQSHHASAVTTTVIQMSSTATTAVTTKSQLSVGYKSSTAAVQRQEVETPHDHVLQFFEEQGKSFIEQQQSKALTPAKMSKRSTSPSPVRQSIGLDHLDNLVKLMEQLSTLRDENLKLKKKCEYLESTKSLLQVKSAVDAELAMLSGFNSLPKVKGKSKSVGHGRGSRPRLPSADDTHSLSLESVATSDVSPKRPKAKLSVRSHSTGSLDIPSDIMEASGEEEIQEKIEEISKSYEKRQGRAGSKSSKSPSAKRKSKISNWSKIIKVLTRQKPDDIGISVRTKKDFVPGLTMSASSPKELTVPSSSAVDGKSVDSGMGSGLEAEGPEGPRKSTSSGEPISPSSQSPSHEEKSRMMEELSSDIWMGPPEWLEEHEDELVTPTHCLEQKEIIILKSAAEREKDKYLHVQFPRRKSSPSLLDHDDKMSDSSEEDRYSPLRRSSSCKEQGSIGEDGKEHHILGSPKITKKLRKKTIGKVMKMVHIRKDSIKKKLVKKSGQRPSEYEPQSGEELSEIDLEGYEELGDELEGPLGRSTPKTSPIPIRQGRADARVAAAAMLGQMGGSIDVSALVGKQRYRYC